MEVETNMYDKCEHFYNCAVEVLTNTLTGEQSIGWVPMGGEICKIWMDNDAAAEEEEDA